LTIDKMGVQAGGQTKIWGLWPTQAPLRTATANNCSLW